ncbi:hypothetical protein D3218_03240 [Aureimonas flava]|uniref:Uncharacterized protein n=1 Tax=Aureimonas flava TaxID=2320271 RepID=A0A3A1WRR4_9HYPH|nr:hypothetical protein [Aureimonas flava]RIY03764.1 hypothetical protein D3218_03240 [Aureimonas flava]
MYQEAASYIVKVRRFAGGEQCPLAHDAKVILARAPNLCALISLRPRKGSSGTLTYTNHSIEETSPKLILGLQDHSTNG